MNFTEALMDEHLLGQFLRPDPSSWRGLFALARAIDALPPEPQDAEIFSKCAGREWPEKQARELWVNGPRRIGKTFIAALLGLFYGAIKKHKLGPGETARVLIVSPSVNQSKVVKGYLSEFFKAPMFRNLVLRENSREIILKRNRSICVLSGNPKLVRGFSASAVIIDEISFIRADGVNAGEELLRSLRPALARSQGLLICLGSPGIKQGPMYQVCERHYGRNGSDILVWWVKDARLMNPTLSEAMIAKAFEDDPVGAMSEWGGEFRADVALLFSDELITACVDRGINFFPMGGGPLAESHLSAFVDVASGSGSDSMVLCIAGCRADGVRVLDFIREVPPPFNPEEVVRHFCEVLKSYGIASVRGDAYGGRWVSERFLSEGISYIPSEKTRNDIYSEILVLANSGKVALPDDPRLLQQLSRLQRYASRSGKVTFDVPTHVSDDVCNAACGALVFAVDPVCQFDASDPEAVSGLLCDRPAQKYDREFGSPPVAGVWNWKYELW